MNQNAIEILKSDHETVRQLLSKLPEKSANAAKTRQQLFEKLEKELIIHTKLEEEIFYPAFREAGKKQDEAMFYEAKEEHRAVDSLVLPDLEKTDPSGPEFSGRVKVLRELVEHHLDEEEHDLFPRVNELLSDDQLNELGAQMKEMKRSLKAQ
jgi:hemerythrin superfamily protein